MFSNEGGCPSLSIALETSHSHVSIAVGLTVVKSIYRKLLRVLWGIIPKQLDVAWCTAVLLGLLEL